MLMQHEPAAQRVNVILDADFGAEEASAFKELVREALLLHPKEICLDCGSLNFIDSTGLGLLTLARTEAKRHKCDVRLVNVVAEHTRKVLQLMKFDELFKMTTTRGGAAR
jgi:anti-anti-sigma factor